MDASLTSSGFFPQWISLWAIAILISLFALPEWFNYLAIPSIYIIADLALGLSALLVLARPSKTSFLVMIILQLSQSALYLPTVPNHRMLMAFVNLSFFGAFLYSIWKKKRGTEELEQHFFFNEGIRIARSLLIILYFFAALAKLNEGFINPDISCSTRFYGHIVSWFPFLPTGEWVDYLVIYSPIVIEILIPVGLLTKRFRKQSVILGLLFHFALALDLSKRFLNFSTVISALLILFIDRKSLNLSFLKSKNKNLLLVSTFIIIFLLGALQSIYLNLRIVLIVFEHLVFTSLILFLLTLTRASKSEEDLKIFKINKLQFVVLFLLTINALSPYLGIKTRSSFNMYSNLRIESDFSNHHIFGPSLDPFSRLKDSVKILAFKPEIQEAGFQPGMTLTYFEFSRYISDSNLEEVDYIRGGKKQHMSVHSPDSLPTPPSWIERKFLVYRPLGKEITRQCIW